MIDPRVKKLAKILVNYSVEVKKGDKVLLEASDPLGLPILKELYKQVLLKEAYPYLILGTEDLSYFYYKNAVKKQLEAEPEVFEHIVEWMDKSVRIKASKNDRSLGNIDAKRMLTRQKAVRKVSNKLLKKPWVISYWPTPSMAQSAGMSLDELEDFYFKACLQDWKKIGKTLQKIKKRMDGAKKVKIIGEKTNLEFSLKGRLAKAAAGKCNMPDGEVFSAPLDGTMNGRIYFDMPTLRDGKVVEGIELEFKDGEVVKSSAGKNEEYLKKALQTDEGAKRPGEFAIGANYGIKKCMLNTLFDEKIGGTIHIALGKAYEEKLGGGKNKSSIHWDIVKDMRKKGSKVIIDGEVILQDGKILVN